MQSYPTNKLNFHDPSTMEGYDNRASFFDNIPSHMGHDSLMEQQRQYIGINNKMSNSRQVGGMNGKLNPSITPTINTETDSLDPYQLLLGSGSPNKHQTNTNIWNPSQIENDFTLLMERRKQLDSEIASGTIYNNAFFQYEKQKMQNLDPVYNSLLELPILPKFLGEYKPLCLEENIKNNSNNQSSWPDLTIDDINTSFKTIVNLQPGYKLKIIDKKNLVIDDSYFYMLRSEKNGQSRNVIINFLDHLLKQTIQNINKMISDAQENITLNNSYILSNLMHNMSTFIHHFDKIKKIYKTDNTACVKLEVIHNNYVNCHTIIFQQLSNK